MAASSATAIPPEARQYGQVAPMTKIEMIVR